MPVYAVNPLDLESVLQTITEIGALLDAQTRAQEVVAGLRARIAKVRARVAGAHRRPKVFFQMDISPMISAGSNTFIDTLIEAAGGINVAAGPAPYPRFSREQVIGLAPDVIVISAMGQSDLFARAKAEWLQWPAVPAVRQGAIFAASSDLFDRASPRLVDALEQLAAYIHPELHGDQPR